MSGGLDRYKQTVSEIKRREEKREEEIGDHQ